MADHRDVGSALRVRRAGCAAPGAVLDEVARAYIPTLRRLEFDRLAALRSGARRTAHLLEQLLALARYEFNGSGDDAGDAAG